MISGKFLQNKQLNGINFHLHSLKQLFSVSLEVFSPYKPDYKDRIFNLCQVPGCKSLLGKYSLFRSISILRSFNCKSVSVPPGLHWKTQNILYSGVSLL